jgi:penicillin-binding protein 2
MIKGLLTFITWNSKHIKVEGIDIAGKTGTAENFAKLEEKSSTEGSLYFCAAFAPKDNPKLPSPF